MSTGELFEGLPVPARPEPPPVETPEVRVLRPNRQQRQGRPSDLESTLFVDAGAVADRPGELRPRYGIGAGVRWKSPVGPVEGALAYGLHSRKFRVHFNAGFVF